MGFLDFLKKQSPQPIDVAMPPAPKQYSDNSSIQPPNASPQSLPPLPDAGSGEWDPFSNLNANNDASSTKPKTAAQIMKIVEEIEIPTPPSQIVPSNEVDIPLPPASPVLPTQQKQSDFALPPISQTSSKQSDFALPPIPEDTFKSDKSSSSSPFANDLYSQPVAAPALVVQPPSMAPIQQPVTQNSPSSTNSPINTPINTPISSLSIDLPDFTDDEIAALDAIQKSIQDNAAAKNVVKNDMSAPMMPLAVSSQSTGPRPSLLDLSDTDNSKSLSSDSKFADDPTQNVSAKKNLFSDEEIIHTPSNAVAMPSDSITLPVAIDVNSEDLIPTKFISSHEYFNIKLELASIRKSLRSNDDITKDGISRHEQLDVLYKKVTQDLNTFEASIMKIDNALFEE